MDLLLLCLIALSLATDCFAVALSGSITRRTISYAQTLRISAAFGLAQFIMPILGWLAGRRIVEVISSYDHWVAFGLLLAVGSRMIWESFHSEDERARASDITRGLSLLVLSLATSIDSLAVGLSFAFLEINIIMASSIIGAIAFSITAIGYLLGTRANILLGDKAKFAGGIILIAIGLRILLTHIL